MNKILDNNEIKQLRLEGFDALRYLNYNKFCTLEKYLHDSYVTDHYIQVFVCVHCFLKSLV